MRLTVLGSGSPEPCVRRASSGFLLEVSGAKLLFDCGGGVFDRLLQAGYGPSDVDYLFFSHLHSDHMMDFARLVHARWDSDATPLKVFGPPPVAEVTERLFGPDGAFAHDLRARTQFPSSQEVWLARGGSLPRPWPAPLVTEVRPGFSFDGTGWRVRSCEVPHVQPLLECMELAVTDGAKKFVYAGDAGVCPELETLCRSADLLLHWCYRLDGESANPHTERLTPTPGEIARMSERNRVRKLVLTHFRIHMDTEANHAMAMHHMKAGFSGPASIAEDLQVHVI